MRFTLLLASHVKFEHIPVLPARLSGAAAGNCAHRFIGKVHCLLLVKADYIGPRPWARLRGHGELLKLLRPLISESESEATGNLCSEMSIKFRDTSASLSGRPGLSFLTGSSVTV